MKTLVAGTVIAVIAGSGAALAADLPLRGAPPPPALAESFDWSGFYFGGNLGFTRGKARWTDITGYNGVGETFTYKPGSIGGDLHAGYNAQFGLMVVGAEAEIGHLNLKKSQQYPKFVGIRGPLDSVAETHGGLYGALSARVGIAIDSLMIYGRGGLVTSDIRQKFIDSDVAGSVLNDGVTTKRPRNGYTFGGGVAMAVGQNLSIHAEYNYYNFGAKTHTASIPWGTRYDFRHSLSANVFKIGMDYRFGAPAAPVVAKY